MNVLRFLIPPPVPCLRTMLAEDHTLSTTVNSVSSHFSGKRKKKPAAYPVLATYLISQVRKRLMGSAFSATWFLLPAALRPRRTECFHRTGLMSAPFEESWSCRPGPWPLFSRQDTCCPATPLCLYLIKRQHKKTNRRGTTKADHAHFERKACRQETSRSCHAGVDYFISEPAVTGKKTQIPTCK